MVGVNWHRRGTFLQHRLIGMGMDKQLHSWFSRFIHLFVMVYRKYLTFICTHYQNKVGCMNPQASVWANSWNNCKRCCIVTIFLICAYTCTHDNIGTLNRCEILPIYTTSCFTRALCKQQHCIKIHVFKNVVIRTLQLILRKRKVQESKWGKANEYT